MTQQLYRTAKVRAIKTIVVAGSPIARPPATAGDLKAHKGRYEPSVGSLRTPKSVGHIDYGTHGEVIDFNDAEVLIRFEVGGPHETIPLWIEKAHIWSCLEYLA